MSSRAAFATYVEAWRSRDARAIADLHAYTSTLWVRNGTPPLEGRAAIAAQLQAVFAQYPRFDFDIRRTLFGDRHWVLEATMRLELPGWGGPTSVSRIDLLDIVDINREGEVASKVTFLDASHVREARARLGRRP